MKLLNFSYLLSFANTCVLYGSNNPTSMNLRASNTIPDSPCIWADQYWYEGNEKNR